MTKTDKVYAATSELSTLQSGEWPVYKVDLTAAQVAAAGECLSVGFVKADSTFSEEYLRWIVEEKNVEAMFDVIRKLVAVSYGVMSEDGRAFRKKPDDVYDFLHSAAYDALIEKFMAEGNDQFITEFIIGVFPAKFADSIRQSMKQGQIDVVK